MTRFKHLMAAFAVALAPAAMAADTAVKDLGLKGEIVLGATSAPVEIIEYGSLTCPHCARFATEILPEFKKEYIDTGKVRFIFRNFVRDRYDMAATAAARCTTDKDKAMSMMEELFGAQKQWMLSKNPYEAIAAIVARSGVSQEDYGVCLTNDGLQKDLIDTKMEGARMYKIDHVPTFLVNGMPVEGYELEDLRKHVAGAH